MLRNRRVDLAVAALAIVLLAVSFAPWWREISLESHTTDAWHRSATWAATIGVVLIATGLWLVRTDRRSRVVAGSSAAVATGWFLAYTWLISASSIPTKATTTIAGQPTAPETRFAGFSYGPYLGSLLIVALVSTMVVALAVDLVRHRPRPGEFRGLAPTVTIVAGLALLASSFAPWWHDDPQTANVWFSSTLWSGCLVATGLALFIWWRGRRVWARIAATGLAVAASVTVAVYTWTLPHASGRSYYVYVVEVPFNDFNADPPVPSLIHRDHLVADKGISGVDTGAYLGIGLIVLVAVVMVLVTLGPPVARRVRRGGAAR